MNFIIITIGSMSRINFILGDEGINIGLLCLDNKLKIIIKRIILNRHLIIELKDGYTEFNPES